MSESPSSRLPVEIWGEILSWTTARVELAYQRKRARRSSQSLNPWVLALVCKDWRDAVYSTPCVWTNIFLEVFFNQHNNPIYDALLSTLKLCLDRSGDLPLTITIQFYPSGLELSSDQFSVFLKLLVEHAPRWETIALGAPVEILLQHFSNYTTRYTRLRRLYIADCHIKSQEDLVVGSLFQDAPLLTHISFLHLPYYGQHLGAVGIPWSQITHLHISIENGQLNALVGILKDTSNLVVLDYSVRYDSIGRGELPMLELPHLQRLVWDSDAADPSTSEFFQLLKAPQLSVLKVVGVCSDTEVEAIRSCLERSGCSITSLNLSTPRLSSVLCLTPDIKTLAFKNGWNVFHVNNDPGNGNGSLHNFELAHLEKIKVITRNRFDSKALDISPLFEVLEAPKLSEMIVDGECSDREVECICACLQRSRCSIKSLELPTLCSLPSIHISTLDVETLVLPRSTQKHLMPLLEELTFDHSADSWFFPKLTKLVLGFDIVAGPLFDAFICMLKSRLWVLRDSLVGLRCNRLKELELRPYVLEDMRDRIQERLTPQESLVITTEKPRWDRGPRDIWKFCK